MLTFVELEIVGRSWVTLNVNVKVPLPLLTLSTTFTVMEYDTGAKVDPDVTLMTPPDEIVSADEPPVFEKTRWTPDRVSSVATDEVNEPELLAPTEPDVVVATIVNGAELGVTLALGLDDAELPTALMAVTLKV
jgi:hypothetical protein